MSASSNRFDELSLRVAAKADKGFRQIYERTDLFKELLLNYPPNQPISKQEICALLRFNPDTNSFYNFISALRKDGVITYKQVPQRPGLFRFQLLGADVPETPDVQPNPEPLTLEEEKEPVMDNDNPEITYSLKQLEDLAIRWIVLETREGYTLSVQEFLKYLKAQEN